MNLISSKSVIMLSKLLVKDHHVSADNVWKYLVLYLNKSVE